jgi:hypothetical protein
MRLAPCARQRSLENEIHNLRRRFLMRTSPDNMIEAAANAERLLRNFGARGLNLGDLVKDLTNRGLIPKRISGDALAAHRILCRATRDAVPPNDVETRIWQDGITDLTKWVMSQSDLRAPIVTPAAEDASASDDNRDRPTKRRLQPWVAMSAVVAVAAVIGTAGHALQLENHFVPAFPEAAAHHR